MLTVDSKNFDFKNITLPVCAEGNAKDAYFTFKLFFTLLEKIKELVLESLLKDLLSSVSKYLGNIEYLGMDVDPDKVTSLRRHLKSKLEDMEDSLYAFPQIKQTDNLKSNDNLKEILYTRETGFGFYPPDKTKSGDNPSVSAPTIELLIEQIEEELEKRAKSCKK